jgi:hypothetical protein
MTTSQQGLLTNQSLDRGVTNNVCQIEYHMAFTAYQTSDHMSAVGIHCLIIQYKIYLCLPLNAPPPPKKKTEYQVHPPIPPHET